MSTNYFPYNPEKAAMNNPAIQLFGNRFFMDQTVSELLVEFLLVIHSSKRIGPDLVFNSMLPDYPQLLEWKNEELKYAPPARLNLKLFSFLSASRLDSRHQTHRSHFEDLYKQLKERIVSQGESEKENIIRTIENLFLGFQGAGSGRTWCAQSFIPIASSLLAGETIWNETEARRSQPEFWEDVIEYQNKYLTRNKHRFLGRGGELLYLQICNALQQPKEEIAAWCERNDIGLLPEEQDPQWLHAKLGQLLADLMNYCPAPLDDLALFIDRALDPDTPEQTDGTPEDRRFVSAGWCNAESWQEGYMFAVELCRLLQTNLDLIERIHLLECACAMQLLRTLALQSGRTSDEETPISWPGYRLVVSAPDENHPAVRRLSQSTLKMMEKRIFKALRSNSVTIRIEEEEKWQKQLNQADKSYGGKLFVGVSKRIGFVIPKKGSGARFVLNDDLLRMLVVTTVPIGGRLTYDTFKQKLESRYGLVFDADGLARASSWINGNDVYLDADTDKWLQRMLEAAGFLIHLSDSCALVHNPTDQIEREER